MLFKSRSEEIKKDISRAISVMWYLVKLYIKSMFAFWGLFFLLAVKAHRNPFVEFQKYSGNEFYTTSVNCALGMMIIFLAFKFAVWLFDRPIKDSNVVVNVIAVRDTSLGVAKEIRGENEKERKDRAIKESPKSKTE
jgi:hypothetical protein